jgi:apolipoprotein N-acyltransferase
MSAIRQQPVDRPRTKRQERPVTAPDPENSKPEPERFLSPTLLLGLAGAILLWAAFPPLNLPWLAWIAPVPWLWLVAGSRLAGRRPYVALWLAGFAHWLLLLQGIRLAHPALYAGWMALAAYLGLYLPVFVGLSRVAVHQLRLPLVAAAPLVWVGLELLRGYLITGFSLCLLAHTQADFPRLIQVSDLAGGYTLSFVLMVVAACVTVLWQQRRLSMPPLAIAATALGMTLGYGSWRLGQTPPGAAGPTLHVALIQGSIDTVFEASAERSRETFAQYRSLTDHSVRQRANLDLIVWPESMFVVPESAVEEPLIPPPDTGLTADQARQRIKAHNEPFRAALADAAARANASTDDKHDGTRLIIGTASYVYGSAEPRIYNAALLADRAGHVEARYYKSHPVMFGEYIPFADWLPWLYRITPITGGLSRGAGPTVFDVSGLRLAPSVCFESTVPHLIRGQVRALARRGTPADCLVNITNDGWFWGSAILDHHLRCGQFRAVENRKPLLIAANTGITAWIDASGVVQARALRRTPQVVLADVKADARRSPYQVIGDLPAWLLAAFCLWLAMVGLWAGWRGGPGFKENPAE